MKKDKRKHANHYSSDVDDVKIRRKKSHKKLKSSIDSEKRVMKQRDRSYSPRSRSNSEEDLIPHKNSSNIRRERYSGSRRERKIYGQRNDDIENKRYHDFDDGDDDDDSGSVRKKNCADKYSDFRKDKKESYRLEKNTYRGEKYKSNASRSKDKHDSSASSSQFGLRKNFKKEPVSDEFRNRSEIKWGKKELWENSGTVEKAPIEKEKPNFVPSGKLLEDTNMYKGVVIKYNEPPDARKSKIRWRLYPFKGDEALPVLYVHRQSAYLIGRDRKIADLPVDHPSCSKQHAVLQYRLVSDERSDGTVVKRIKPYIIDLASVNGTYLNGERIEPQRYYELREKDLIKFGYSTREFVLLNEKSCQEEEPKEEIKKEVE